MKDGEFTAFRLWNLAHLHFTTEKFDLTKTKSVKGLHSRFDKLSRNEVAVFRRLSDLFPEEREFCKMLVSCYLNGFNPRYSSFETTKTAHKEYVRARESLTYRIGQDLDYVDTTCSSYHDLFFELDNSKILPETIIVLDRKHNFLDFCQSDFTFLAYEKQIMAIRKYRAIYNGEKHSVLYTDNVKFLTEQAIV